MSWKDKLNSSQSGGEKYPKLDISLIVNIKENNNKPCFSWWDRDVEQRQFLNKPLEGVLIGKALKCSAFDDNFGRNGGSYQSALYVNNQNITMFSPSGNSRKTGSMEEIENWLTSEGVKDSISKKMCLLVLTSKGLFQVETNTSIAIQQLDDYSDQLGSHFIKLTPTELNPKDESITKKTRKYLGKFADKNPPKYASISIGDQITDEQAETLDIVKYCDMYEAWKDYASKNSATLVEDAVTDETKSDNYDPLADDRYGKHVMTADELSDLEAATDDLPF